MVSSDRGRTSPQGPEPGGWRSATWWSGVSSIASLIGVAVALLAWWYPANPEAKPKPPQASSAATPTASAGQRGPVYLASLRQLEPSNPFVTVGQAQVGGRIYPNSLTLQIVSNSNSAAVEYSLARRFTRLTATAGISDTSISITAVVEIVIDGRKSASAEVKLGKGTQFNLDVTNAETLRIVVRAESTDSSCCPAVAIASPELMPAA